MSNSRYTVYFLGQNKPLESVFATLHGVYVVCVHGSHVGRCGRWAVVGSWWVCGVVVVIRVCPGWSEVVWVVSGRYKQIHFAKIGQS